MITDLQKWMNSKGMGDLRLSQLTNVSRSHISRIRRGKSGANKALALRLEHLTQIGWEHFIEPQIKVSPLKKKTTAPAASR